MDGLTFDKVRALLDASADALYRLYADACTAAADVDPALVPDVRIDLIDDTQGTMLGRLTGPGVALAGMLLRSHTCDGTCTPDGCPALYLAWVIAGCPDGEPS